MSIFPQVNQTDTHPPACYMFLSFLRQMCCSAQELYSEDIMLTKYLLILKQGSSGNTLRCQVHRGICIFAGHSQLSVGDISVAWGRRLQSFSDYRANIGARQVISKPNHGGKCLPHQLQSCFRDFNIYCILWWQPQNDILFSTN